MRKFCLVCLSLLLIGKIFSQCPPHVQITMPLPTFTLTCNNPTILAIGSSTTSDTEISWIVPSTPSLINSSTVIVGPPNGPPTSSLTFSYANYTVVATNTVLACSSSSVVFMKQDFRPPYLNPTTFGPPEICKGNALITVGTSSYTQYCGACPGFIIGSWAGPAPQNSITGVSSYSAFIPGIYTLSCNDNYTGCNGTATIQITDSRPQFGLQGSAPTSSASCNGSVIVTTQIPYGYSLSATSGSLSGTTLNNLCYGWVKVCMTFTDTQCFKCDSILMNAATSLNEINLEDEILIYPNPTSASFFIKNTYHKNVVVKIFDVEGRELLFDALETTTVGASRASATSPGSSAEQEIKNIKAGIYCIEFRSENSVLRKKLLVSP